MDGSTYRPTQWTVLTSMLTYPPGRTHPHVMSVKGRFWHDLRWLINSTPGGDIGFPCRETDSGAHVTEWFHSKPGYHGRSKHGIDVICDGISSKIFNLNLLHNSWLQCFLQAHHTEGVTIYNHLNNTSDLKEKSISPFMSSIKGLTPIHHWNVCIWAPQQTHWMCKRGPLCLSVVCIVMYPDHQPLAMIMI